ncbi:MAG: type IV pilus modification PilV family protein, partial [Syntrophales bacterium]
MNKNKNGFSLIEVLIGLVLLAIGLLAIAGMQISSVRGNFFSSNLTQASVLAQDRLETLRNIAYGDAALNAGNHNDGLI